MIKRAMVVVLMICFAASNVQAQGVLGGFPRRKMPTLTQADFEVAVQKAKANDPEALYTMAQAFAAGKIVPQDGKSAYAYLKESADAGCGKATLAIGLLEEYGCAPWQYQDLVAEYGWIHAVAHGSRINVGNSNDVARVTALYANAKAKGIEFAEVVRTNLLAKVEAHYVQERKRIVDEEQRKRNAEMVLRALEFENPERQAQRRLRETGSSSKVTVENLLPLEEALKKAEGGDAEAMYSLALRYLSGTDVKGNDKAVRKFLTGAAEKGHGGAQYILGILCQHELETPMSSAWQNSQSEVRMFKFTKANRVYFVSPFDEGKYLGGLLNSNTVSKMLGYFAAASSNAVPEAAEAYKVAKQMVETTNAELQLKKVNGEKLDAYFAAMMPTNSAPVESNRPTSRSSFLGRRNSFLQESQQKAEKERETEEDVEKRTEENSKRTREIENAKKRVKEQTQVEVTQKFAEEELALWSSWPTGISDEEKMDIRAQMERKFNCVLMNDDYLSRSSTNSWRSGRGVSCILKQNSQYEKDFLQKIDASGKVVGISRSGAIDYEIFEELKWLNDLENVRIAEHQEKWAKEHDMVLDEAKAKYAKWRGEHPVVRRPFGGLLRPGMLGGGVGGSLRARRLQRQLAAKEAERQAQAEQERAERDAEREQQRQQLMAIQEELRKAREQRAKQDAETGELP